MFARNTQRIICRRVLSTRKFGSHAQPQQPIRGMEPVDFTPNKLPTPYLPGDYIREPPVVQWSFNRDFTQVSPNAWEINYESNFAAFAPPSRKPIFPSLVFGLTTGLLVARACYSCDNAWSVERAFNRLSPKRKIEVLNWYKKRIEVEYPNEEYLSIIDAHTSILQEKVGV